MKTKTPTGRTPRPRAPAKAKADPQQAPLPHVPGTEHSEPEAAAPPKQTLKIPEVLAELESAAKPLNVRVTYEAIGGELGAGGLCKVKGLWRVIIDKRTTPSERVSVLAPALARFDFGSLTLSPQVRELLTRVAPAPVAPPVEESAAADAEEDAGAAADAGALASTEGADEMAATAMDAATADSVEAADEATAESARDDAERAESSVAASVTHSLDGSSGGAAASVP